MTDQRPLITLDVVTDVHWTGVGVKVDVQSETVIRPRAKLHTTFLQTTADIETYCLLQM